MPNNPALISDEAIDLLVIGAGAAGMTAALVGAIVGLRTVLCEKTGMVGGITSRSAGTVWIPGSHQSTRAGIPDPVEDAKTYLNAILPPSYSAGVPPCMPRERRDSGQRYEAHHRTTR
jgi:phytoene dehydrogenase-like protein